MLWTLFEFDCPGTSPLPQTLIVVPRGFAEAAQIVRNQAGVDVLQRQEACGTVYRIREAGSLREVTAGMRGCRFGYRNGEPVWLEEPEEPGLLAELGLSYRTLEEFLKSSDVLVLLPGEVHACA